MSATVDTGATLNPRMNNLNENISALKQELPTVVVQYEVKEGKEIDKIYEACDKLEEDLRVGDDWILYEDFEVGESVVEIVISTDADESEFTDGEIQ